MLLKELHDFDDDPKQAAGNLVRQRAQQMRGNDSSRKSPSWDNEPTRTVELHFYQPGPDGMPDEENNKLTVVEIDVEYNVTDDEYDGPHLFSRGDTEVTWHVAKSFVWNGQQLNKLVPQMAPCCEEIAGLGYDATEAYDKGDVAECNRLLDQAVKSQLDMSKVQPGSRQYPDSRSV